MKRIIGSIAALLAAFTMLGAAAFAEETPTPRAAYCGNCGSMGIVTNLLNVSSTGPTQQLCQHKPYGVDYIWEDVYLYLSKCGVCQYQYTFTTTGTRVECHGNMTP